MTLQDVLSKMKVYDIVEIHYKGTTSVGSVIDALYEPHIEKILTNEIERISAVVGCVVIEVK